MIPFNDTDLQIVNVEIDPDDSTSFYLLILADMADDLDLERLMDELAALEESDNDDDQKDNDYQELLERMGIIEIFDQDEIEDMIEEGLINPEDLHYSLYQIATEEMDLES